MHANTQPKGRAKLIIYKRKRRLELWLGDACHAVYPVALGFASSGPNKARETAVRRKERTRFVHAMRKAGFIFRWAFPIPTRPTRKKPLSRAELMKLLINALCWPIAPKGARRGIRRWAVPS